MMIRRQFGRLHLFASTSAFDDHLGLDTADVALLAVAGSLAFGVTATRGPMGNPFGRLYLGVVEVEAYYDRQLEHDAA